MIGAPTKTRTRIGRLGGNCSILLSYRRVGNAIVKRITQKSNQLKAGINYSLLLRILVISISPSALLVLGLDAPLNKSSILFL